MPLDRTLAQMEGLEESIKKREKKLLDYDEARTRVNKASQKASDHAKLAKLQEQEAQARIAYESLHTEILNCIPRVNQARQAILNEILVRFKDINHRFASDMGRYALNSSSTNNNNSGHTSLASKQKIRENLEAIKHLSITTK